MLAYTLPGYYSNRDAEKLKEKLTGKTFYNFMVEYGGVAGNNEIVIMSATPEYTQEEFTEFVIAYAFSELARA